MSRPPKISVVTPTFNGIVTLHETIESVLAQDYRNWEHIVVDGGSTDGTVDLLRTYSHLQWVSEKDKGHYHAMNKGIDRASGEVVAILNADSRSPQQIHRFVDIVLAGGGAKPRDDRRDCDIGAGAFD